MIDYDHSQNLHTVAGAKSVLSAIFVEGVPRSLLDVGCGAGTWLAAARNLGIADIMGVDGVAIPGDQLLVASTQITQQDLRRDWNLGRRFDMALCLEVAEHLESSHARSLVEALVAHADRVVFSAACPGQSGQHHVNCQWPVYWQELFNERGYSCSDAIRWRIWDDSCVEPWYRQNIFEARCAPVSAGREVRIRSVIHPDLMEAITTGAAIAGLVSGRYPVRMILRAFVASLQRKFSRLT